jgi:hypothetical protein
MDFLKLQAMGGIVSAAPVRKEITFTYHRPLPADQWSDPDVPEVEPEPATDTATVWIRKRTSRDFLDINAAAPGEQVFLALFRCVCTEDGAPLFPSVEDASRLAEWMLIPLMKAVNEVNSFLPKAFPPKTSSGATSPSPSAAVRSASGRKRSTRKSARSG